ncbi:MAG: YIP1 family protein [Candidatus Diapherotrites archaeon]|nr:YIP1 family protein [Candidatus Diapherotrites archaeon]
MKSASIFGELKRLFFSPSKFFDYVKQDKNPNRAVIWAAVSAIVYLVFYGIFIFLGYDYSNPFGFSFAPRDSAWFDVVFMVLSLVFHFVASLILIPFSHFIAVKLGAKHGWENTVKALFYPYIVLFSLSWIPVIGSLFWLYGIYISFRAFRSLQEMSRGNVIAFIVIDLILSLLILLLAAIIIEFAFVLLFVVLKPFG